MTVILDADPEVYRLGSGDQEALEAIRTASAKTYFRIPSIHVDNDSRPYVRFGAVATIERATVKGAIRPYDPAPSV